MSLKNSGWKAILSFWKWALFFLGDMLVFGWFLQVFGQEHAVFILEVSLWRFSITNDEQMKLVAES